MTMIGRTAPAEDGGRTRMTVRVGVSGSLVGAVLLGAIMALPWGVSAQEASPPPAPSAMTELDTSDLVALFPTTVADVPYTAHSVAGADWIEDLANDDPGTVTLAQELTEALAAHGRDPSDLTVAFGRWSDEGSEPYDLTLIAFRIEDGDASWLVPVLTASYFDPDAVLTQVELGGKTVSAVGQPGQSPLGYVYASGDVLWLIRENAVRSLLAGLP